MASSTAVHHITQRIRQGGPADRGDIVLGWLVRVVLLLGLLALFVFEGLSLVTAKVSGTDMANQVAYEASESYLSTRGTEKARLKAARMAAETKAAEHAAEVVTNTFTVQEDGTVKLKIRRTATTLLIYRTKQTAALAVIVSDGHARSVPQ